MESFSNTTSGNNPLLTLIRQAHVFTPLDFGRGDILLAGNVVAAIDQKIDLPGGLDVRVVDGKKMIATPGFIDLHVHITGGGGEGGPATRVPEIDFATIVESGVTTVVGLLGTDDVSRSPAGLLAKALALEQQGLNAFIFSGSYSFPPVETVTGSLKKDLMFIPQVVGVGELAVSDHRSAAPTIDDLAKVAAAARVGGMLGNKAGLVHLHMGGGRERLEPLFKLVRETDIPITQFLPTHVNRSRELFSQALNFLEAKGNIDITVLSEDDRTLPITLTEAIRTILEKHGSLDGVTLSSDANGSLPKFDDQGEFIGMGVGQIDVLRQGIKTLVKKENIPTELILPCVTSNPAARLKCHHRKGGIAPGMDADLVLFDFDWQVQQVYCRGKLLATGGKALSTV